MTTTNELDLEMPEEATTPDDTTSQSGGGNPPADDTTTSPEELLAKELSVAKEALARAQADYKNLLSRTERERGEMISFLTQKVLLKVIPSLDSLERILAGTPESDRSNVLYQGVESTASGLIKSLGTLGLESFSSIGSTLDPAIHEAIMQAPGENDIIIAEVEKGYKLSDKVIRHAKVVVGNGESA